MLTQVRLKELLAYDPVTGIFINRRSRGAAKAGKTAGTNLDGYLVIRIDGRLIRAHTLAWLYIHGEWIEANNAIKNLRPCTHGENMINKRQNWAHNTSGATGVCWHKAARKYRAAIQVNSKTIHLGLFLRVQDAVAARKLAEMKFFGEFSPSVEEAQC